MDPKDQQKFRHTSINQTSAQLSHSSEESWHSSHEDKQNELKEQLVPDIEKNKVLDALKDGLANQFNDLQDIQLRRSHTRTIKQRNKSIFLEELEEAQLQNNINNSVIIGDKEESDISSEEKEDEKPIDRAEYKFELIEQLRKQ